MAELAVAELGLAADVGANHVEILRNIAENHLVLVLGFVIPCALCAELACDCIIDRYKDIGTTAHTVDGLFEPCRIGFEGYY